MLIYRGFADKVPQVTNKWIARSAFQKAIRRGQSMRALMFGEWLYCLDKSYFWYTLVTIAFEDVGLGSPRIVGQIGNIFRSVSLQQKISVRDIQILINRLAQAPKSQVFCDLSLELDLRFPDKVDVITKLGSIDEDALRDKLYNGSLKESYLAMRVLWGKVPGLPTNNNVRRCIREEISNLKEEFRDLAMIASYCHFDTMTVAVLPVILYIQKNNLMWDFSHKQLCDSVFIKGVAAEVFDMHTSQGKRAIRLFYKKLMYRKDYREVLSQISHEEVGKAIGACVFICEGGLVANPIIADWCTSIKTDSMRAFAIGYGVPEDYVDNVLTIVRENLSLLNDCRDYILSTS